MVDDNRWGILYCPKSGLLSSPAKTWEKVEKSLKEQHVEYDHIQSESVGSVDRLVKMFINNGYKTIIIVGGDSALNDAVNCLMQVDKATRDSIRLGVIPNGMMNDFAHFWGIESDDIAANIAWLKKGRVRKVDLGCIRYYNKEREACHRYFLNCVNVGLIASIMTLKRRTRHLLGSRHLSFILSFILMVFQRMDYKMRIFINSDKIDRGVMTVCVGNALGYGQTPNAVPYNGLLDVSIAYNRGVTQLLQGIWLFLKGKILNHRGVLPYRTREVVFDRTQHAPVCVDGRPIRTPVGPFKVVVEQEVINFLIPD